MNEATSVIPAPKHPVASPSLAADLFGSVGVMVTMAPPPGSRIHCDYCLRAAVDIIDNCVVVTHRHGSDWHKTIISLTALGYEKVA